jgi:phage FluMu protein Com
MALTARTPPELVECPRCRQIATEPAARRGRCTGCGALLVSARRPRDEVVLSYLELGRAHQGDRQPQAG